MCSSPTLAAPPGCPPRMEWILRVSGPCYIGQKSHSLRSIVYHLFRNHAAALTPDQSWPLKVVSLPESSLRPDLGNRHTVNMNNPLLKSGGAVLARRKRRLYPSSVPPGKAMPARTEQRQIT